MSVTISLKDTTAHRHDVVRGVIQFGLLLAVLLIVLGLVDVFSHRLTHNAAAASQRAVVEAEVGAALAALAARPDAASRQAVARGETALPVALTDMPPAGDLASAVELSPRMRGALDYVKNRYKVPQEALLPVFEIVQLIGKEMRVDPLLIVAVIGIESGFNPFAESSMGARGLMQVIPRFHRDKVPPGAGDGLFLDPVTNIRVGVQVLEEAIRRAGGLVPGLQQYAGSSQPDNAYASRVLAEKERLEQAARRNRAANAEV